MLSRLRRSPFRPKIKIPPWHALHGSNYFKAFDRVRSKFHSLFQPLTRDYRYLYVLEEQNEGQIAHSRAVTPHVPKFVKYMETI